MSLLCRWYGNSLKEFSALGFALLNFFLEPEMEPYRRSTDSQFNIIFKQVGHPRVPLILL